MAEAEFAGARLEAAVEGQREGRAAELGRIKPEEKVVHDRVADDRRLENLAALDPRFISEFADQRVHRRAHAAGQIGFAARVHHDVGDAAHQIFAEADLRVHRRRPRRRLRRSARSHRCAAIVVEPMSKASP